MTMEFLQNFGSSFPSSKLILYTNDMDVRDYFINVASILFNITVIYKNRDQFLNIETTNENDVSLIVNFEGDLNKVEILTRDIYKIENDSVVNIKYKGMSDREKEEEKFLEPISLYKLLTI